MPCRTPYKEPRSSSGWRTHRIAAPGTGIGADFPIKVIKGYSTQSGSSRYQVVRSNESNNSVQEWVLASCLEASTIVRRNFKRPTRRHEGQDMRFSCGGMNHCSSVPYVQGTVIPGAVASLDHAKHIGWTPARCPSATQPCVGPQDR